MAEADPERLMADTEAWRSRRLNVDDFELQRPLYSINTYTDTQVRHNKLYSLVTFSFTRAPQLPGHLPHIPDLCFAYYEPAKASFPSSHDDDQLFTIHLVSLWVRLTNAPCSGG